MKRKKWSTEQKAKHSLVMKKAWTKRSELPTPASGPVFIIYRGVVYRRTGEVKVLD